MNIFTDPEKAFQPFTTVAYATSTECTNDGKYVKLH